MPTKLMLAFVGFDFLFAGCGGLLLGFSLMSEAAMQEKPTVANVTQNLLLGQCPLTAGVVNAIFIFVTFLLSLPALFLPTNRGWLRAQGWLVVICATFTLGLGVAIWVETLQTRKNLSNLWGRESPQIQSLLQQKVEYIEFRAWQKRMLTYSSLTAVAMSMLPHLHLYRIRLAQTPLLQRRRVGASLLSLPSPTSISTKSSLQRSALLVSTSFSSSASPWFSSTGWSRSATGTSTRRTAEEFKECRGGMARGAWKYWGKRVGEVCGFCRRRVANIYPILNVSFFPSHFGLR
jgi:hypothetical protein